MISERGLALIARFEGFRLLAYPDPGTGNQPYTIGYGHTGGVAPSDTCTEEEALEWLREDCAKAEQAVDEQVEVDLTQNERDALISFVFNCGAGNFRSSTMLKLINAGKMEAAAQQFHRWDKAAGRPMAGLLARREAEAALFSEA